MKKGKRTSIYLTISIILSMIVHGLLITLSGFLPFMPKFQKLPQRQPNRFIRLSEVKLPEPQNIAPEKKELTLVPIPEKNKIPTPDKTRQPGKTPGQSTSENDKYRPELPKRIENPDAVPAPPKIIQIDADALPPERARFNRIIIPRIKRHESGTGLAPASTAVRPPRPKIPVSMRVSPPKPPTTNLPDIPETRLITPEKASPLDKLMAVEISTKQNPDGSGFYRIDIKPRRGAEKLHTFPKDIVFLIDVSGSISQVKLNEFRQGLRKIIKQIPPEDRFEIVAFRHQPYPLFGTLRKPNPENLKLADDFLFKLQRVGSTNIYSALAPYAGKQLKTPGRPLLVFLLSDGQVNYGEVIDSRQLINVISNKNQENASIFTFSAGNYVNPFLMELISYRNRGESRRSSDIEQSRMKLHEFISAVSDIVVADLDFQVSSNLLKDTFPKKLPHLYRDNTLSIYGRYPAGTSEVGLRITGVDSRGERQELIYQGDLNSAKRGGDQLPKRWAMQYIYHLYSRFTANYDESIKLDIHAVAQEYKIHLPYLATYLQPAKKRNYVE